MPPRISTRSFCSCIKKVRKTIKPRKSKRSISLTKRKEQAAIAICVKSVLQTRKRTLRRFSCKRPSFLQTQPLLKKKATRRKRI